MSTSVRARARTRDNSKGRVSKVVRAKRAKAVGGGGDSVGHGVLSVDTRPNGGKTHKSMSKLAESADVSLDIDNVSGHMSSQPQEWAHGHISLADASEVLKQTNGHLLKDVYEYFISVGRVRNKTHFAKLAGYDPGHTRRVVEGVKNLGMDVASQIEAAFGVETDFFFRQHDIPIKDWIELKKRPTLGPVIPRVDREDTPGSYEIRGRLGMLATKRGRKDVANVLLDSDMQPPPDRASDIWWWIERYDELMAAQPASVSQTRPSQKIPL